MPTTPRLKLPYPAETDPADVPVDLQKLATALDGAGVPGVPLDSQGLLSQLPAPGTLGRYFWATDTATLYRDDGTNWRPVGSQPGDFKYSGAAAAYGWLLCDGSAIPRGGANAALFAAIGVTFGAGDGASTFNVPEQRGRALVGAGQGPGLVARANGARGGEENHQLSAAEMPSHAHALSDPTHAHSLADPGHAHGIANYFTAPIGANNLNAGTNFNAHQNQVYATNGSGTGMGVYGAATGLGVYGAGGDAVHNNMPPFGAANIFIKL